jgi:hypothetical protein
MNSSSSTANRSGQLPAACTSGRKAPFDVIDMLELTDDGRIASLHIVYDTAQVRPAFEQETGRRSWRADL